ncbi:MAG: 6-phosphogluconate dehydrogenase NAD-binding [Akkermansiaceae bacterium]|nr:6-phosphogluconate dehydrogenase NAD-binding [Akkermansiaceae bacterium]
MIVKKIAVIGLGIIGSRAAARLADGPELEVSVWNRTPKDLPGEKATPQEAVAGADIISLYLKDAPAVREIGAQVIAAAAKGAVVMNHSTIDLATTLWLGEQCAAAGLEFLDAPFTGSREAAANGALVYYAAGDETLIESCTWILRKSGKAVIRAGAVGNATILKLVTNLISACTVQALSESLGTATRHGIPADSLIEAVALNACGSPLAAMKLPTMAEGNFETHFSLENMLKDSRYALELAEQAGLETPAIRTVSRRMAELCDAGLGGQDYSALASPYLPQEA